MNNWLLSLDTTQIETSFMMGNYTKYNQSVTRPVIGIGPDSLTGDISLVIGTIIPNNTIHRHYGVNTYFTSNRDSLTKVGINKIPTRELDLDGSIALTGGIYFTIPGTAEIDSEDGYNTVEIISIVRGGTLSDPSIDIYFNPQ